MIDLTLRTVPYDIFGVTLWSVENMNGFIYKYCNTKQQARDSINNTSENLDYYTRTMNKA